MDGNDSGPVAVAQDFVRIWDKSSSHLVPIRAKIPIPLKLTARLAALGQPFFTTQ
jgi:hypothetical protein